MTAKFCKDCKHCAGNAAEDPPCNAPQNMIQNVNKARYLVTGEAQPVQVIRRGGSCSALRQDRGPDTNALTCGPTGAWFEQKESA